MSYTRQEQGWQLVSAITASRAASSPSPHLKHVEKLSLKSPHVWKWRVLTAERVWQGRCFSSSIDPEWSFYKRGNTMQTTLLQSQRSPNLWHTWNVWIELGKHKSSWGSTAVLYIYWSEQNIHHKGCFSLCVSLSPIQAKETHSGLSSCCFHCSSHHHLPPPASN